MFQERVKFRAVKLPGLPEEYSEKSEDKAYENREVISLFLWFLCFWTNSALQKLDLWFNETCFSKHIMSLIWKDSLYISAVNRDTMIESVFSSIILSV